jgi:hypothetical protein
MANNNSANHSIDNHQKLRDAIEAQVQSFINSGGKIEVMGSAFDKNKDPKCRLGEEMGLFV